MLHPRLDPFQLVFGHAAPSVFPAIKAGLAETGKDPRDRDAFVLEREVVTLLRKLRPERGLGEGIDQLVALVHHGYLFWDAGSLILEVPSERLGQLLGAEHQLEEIQEQTPAYYAQLPQHRIWAHAVPESAPEPLDGCFVHLSHDRSSLRVLGVFGLHPERAGFSVVETSGLRPVSLTRQDGRPLFSSTLPGGAAAQLYSLAGEEELLELGWRTGALLTQPSVEAGRWKA
jgi:hypothetical protein